MILQGWQRQYLDALLRSRIHRVGQFESVEFFSSVVENPADAVQELLLHRLIGRLETIPEALELLNLLRDTDWQEYRLRILARIGDMEAILTDQPELEDYFPISRDYNGYITSSVQDWQLIGDGTNLRRPDAPGWTEQTIPIDTLIKRSRIHRISVEEVATVLRYLHDAGMPLFQVALFTFANDENAWAEIFHRIFIAPYIEIATLPYSSNPSVVSTPTARWAPHWQISVDLEDSPNWRVIEIATEHQLKGLGTTGIYDQIGVLLALSGLLREGISLAPLGNELVGPLWASYPDSSLWFVSREDLYADSVYRGDDIRALALGFLAPLPASRRVSALRSNLAMSFVAKPWASRISASIITEKESIYQQLLRVAQLFQEGRFNEVANYIENSAYSSEPAFRYFYRKVQSVRD